MGTHLRVLDKSFRMNTNMTEFKWFSNDFLRPCTLDVSSLSTGRVKAFVLYLISLFRFAGFPVVLSYRMTYMYYIEFLFM